MPSVAQRIVVGLIVLWNVGHAGCTRHDESHRVEEAESAPESAPDWVRPSTARPADIDRATTDPPADAPSAVTPAALPDNPPPASLSEHRQQPEVRPREVEAGRAAAAGIRRIEGPRLTLYTDLPPDDELDALPEIFAQAWTAWCRYFNRPDLIDQPGRMNAYIMGDRARFVASGLLPPEVPEFRHGFALGADLWMDEQPNSYYRRHLLLHEGTHGWMNSVLGNCGPPWYMEGVAELLGTHRWHEGQLTMSYFPIRREDTPDLGRIQLVQRAVAEGRVRRLDDVLDQPFNKLVQNEDYAWSWALAAFLDGTPQYRETFRTLPALVNDNEFNNAFRQRLFADQLADMAVAWLVFVDALEYGYDCPRMALELVDGTPLPPGAARDTLVDATRGWQSSGIRVEAGQTYQLTAAGRYQVDIEPEIWWCEPGGVSIRYVRGRPLGMLLAAVVPDVADLPDAATADLARAAPLLRPQPVGLNATLLPETSGTLYFRINDAPSSLANNAGQLTVTLQAE